MHNPETMRGRHHSSDRAGFIRSNYGVDIEERQLARRQLEEARAEMIFVEDLLHGGAGGPAFVKRYQDTREAYLAAIRAFREGR